MVGAMTGGWATPTEAAALGAAATLALSACGEAPEDNNAGETTSAVTVTDP